MTTHLPPIELALPCRMFAVVTPPGQRAVDRDVARIEHVVHGDHRGDGTEPSLIESAAMCEWQSITPGVTNLPVASSTVAPAGAGDVLADRGDLAAVDQN